MSRRGEAVYEERDYYSREGPPVRTRERGDSDIRSRRSGSERGSRPDFLRDDYGRPEPGQMVLRERDTEVYSRPLERRPRSPSPVRVVRERIIERSPTPPQQLERVRTTRIVERRSPSPPPERVRTKTRVVEKKRSPSLPPPERLRARVVETRERFRERSPSPVRVRERVVEREREIRERTPSPHIDRVRIRNVEQVRQPSPEPSPPPPPPPIRAPPIHQEIITHHRHIDHGFELARVPSPPPRRTEQRTKETDIDIYTHGNHTDVDIRKKTVSTRSPPPARHDDYHDDSVLYEQQREKLRFRDARLDASHRRSVSARPERRERSKSRVRIDIRGDEDEADYYARKAKERAYIGEAYNGATKDWAIIDVPPGTERVTMDGVGGGSEEITWQKYNGVRRSKFIPERERERERDRVVERELIREEPRRESQGSGLEIEISSSSRRRQGGGSYEREYERIEETSSQQVGFPRAPPKQRMGDLWTEITKDLVVREAIEEMGYDFEETEFFFYIIQYLRYEDVLELVQLSETIRRERQDRIREIQRERERIERRNHERDEWERRERRWERDPGFSDERIIEREIIYDGRGPPPRRGGW
ncbi:conserved glutamic acid rich protein [Drepanopeziza brunnea f. sp. 'multigermtubi' MB_m1]|uniref:Conserved glutamic acid rich protein n=1 Tax=Marssonina brunnea f. sp. multigermtubi (strain MB_m1) TaxID=1072389 RepID=K1XPE2_MARBU|nr:conserved glutamic acid rich protein [Drepanopeziza brunnea f. sp. 'multigermtubi' MB_m1]EKD14379.1 conserved glutamic acid rich protein [Drepanopeziza brunnea f. sp. 'multigermtubi' MB_m1]